MKCLWTLFPRGLFLALPVRNVNLLYVKHMRLIPFLYIHMSARRQWAVVSKCDVFSNRGSDLLWWSPLRLWTSLCCASQRFALRMQYSLRSLFKAHKLKCSRIKCTCLIYELRTKRLGHAHVILPFSDSDIHYTSQIFHFSFVFSHKQVPTMCTVLFKGAFSVFFVLIKKNVIT